MLRNRIITGLILAIVALLIIFYLPFSAFLVVTSGIILFSAWEWTSLMGCRSLLCQFLYVIFMAIMMYCAWHAPIIPVLWVAFAWWVAALFLIAFYPKVSKIWSYGIWIRGLMGILVLVPSWLSIDFIMWQQNGAVILVFLLLLVWGADTGAFFSGKFWGKHKLMPLVSPKKTWQGLFGGLTLTILIAAIGCIVLKIIPPYWPIVIVLAVVTVLFSVVGDLLESMLKRQVGIKDVANYLPGHGGFLDRIDSLTAAAPIFLLGFLLLGVK